MRDRWRPSDLNHSEEEFEDSYFEQADIQMPLDESYNPGHQTIYETDADVSELHPMSGNHFDDELYDDEGVYDEDMIYDDQGVEEPYYEQPERPYQEPASGRNQRYAEAEPDVVEEEEERPRPRRRKTDRKKPRRVKNRQIMGILYGFMVLFLGLIAYFLYFDVYKSEDVLNNPNNVRISKLTENIARGRIISSDGSILAETLTSSDGVEYRSYPYANVFSHAVGMAKLNRSGIETMSEYYLLKSDINPMRQMINEIKGVKNPGDDVITTLNCNLQQAAYNALGGYKGVVLAMEPTTGKILAMVSKPDYDPNTLDQYYDDIIADESSKVLLNQATSGTFTPGSIFKMVTSLEYMREYPNYSDYDYQCQGSIILNDAGRDVSLSCYQWSVHGYENLTDSFANSCNSSFANIGLNLNAVKFKSTCDALYFNKKLPTDIPHVKSSFSLKGTDSQWKTGATAIGQGDTTITPLHALMIAGAIANGGVGMKPYMIDYIESRSGDLVEKMSPSSYGEMMTPQEAETLKNMMKAVVNYGTAASLSGHSYQIAGKTGTAEVDNAGNNAWFVGFAPADNPEIAVCVLIEDTDTSSSSSAVPIANIIFESYLGY